MDFWANFGVVEVDVQLFCGSETKCLKSVFDRAGKCVEEAVEIPIFTFTPIFCCFVKDSAWGGVLDGSVVHVL